MELREQLENGIARLMELKGQCYMHIIDEYDLSELSLKQIAYLKKFRADKGITTSQLAEDLELSKPTVTEMVKKFIKMKYVYKETCEIDGRVHYLKLTDQGKNIANVEKLTFKDMVDKLHEKLDEEDLKTLIKLLEKIE
jgi:DNA-binding MarR family transcriptional regulator